MKNIVLSFLSICYGPFSFCQNIQLDSSNLPIVIIDTRGKTISNEPKITAHMKIIYNGPGKMNYRRDQNFHYNNWIGIETRGNSSQSYPQKQYGVELRDSVSGDDLDAELLGMPAEEDWVLYAPYNDISMLRNVLTYHLWNEMSHWGPRTRFCEVILNNTYQGIYILMESIKRGPTRVDISKMNPQDTAGLQLTGGYIMKIDKKNNPNDKSFVSKVKSTTNTDITWLYHYPESDDINPKQQDYIRKYIDTVEQLIASPNFADPVNGYRKYLSTRSFIDYFLLTEFTRNIDAYKASSYFYKEKLSMDGDKGQFKAGPVWDYNFGYGNASFCSGAQTTGWMYDGCMPATLATPVLWRRLLADPTYANEVKCRWQELRRTILDTGYLFPFLNRYAFDTLDAAQKRHFSQWRILGTNPGGFNAYIAISYPDELNRLKTWIRNRLSWMDANMPGSCILPQAKLKAPLDPNCFAGNRPAMTRNHPFGPPPFGYDGKEQISNPAANLIRWVLVELRSGQDSTKLVDRRAALLRNDSTLLDTNLQANLSFYQAKANEDYYVVIRYDAISFVLSKNKIRLPNNLALNLSLVPLQQLPEAGSPLYLESNVYGRDTLRLCAGDSLILIDSILIRLGYNNLSIIADPPEVSIHPLGPGTWTLSSSKPGSYRTSLSRYCNGGFKMSSRLMVEVLPKPAPVIQGIDEFCIGTSINLSTSDFASYLWSTGSREQQIEVRTPGIYTVTVTAANSCLGSDSIAITNYPEIDGTLEVETRFKPDTCLIRFIPADSSQKLNYQWSNGSTSDRTETGPGTIQLKVTDAFGCQKTFETGCIPSGSRDFSEDRGLVVYPNPARDQLNIRSSSSIQKVVFHQVGGSVCLQHETMSPGLNPFAIDIKKLTSGLYILQVHEQDGDVHYFKILVQ